MNAKKWMTLTCCLPLLIPFAASADCPYDHLVIGCNADGRPNTPDDNVLFLDIHDLYRRSDPNHRDEPTWLHWFHTLFPLGGDPGASTFVISEPGFDVCHHPDEPGVYAHEDPARCLLGTPDVQYRIIVECLDISPGFQAGSLFGDILLKEPGDTFNHSAQSDPHVHLYYTAPAPGNELYWIQYRVYDNLYNPADPNHGYQPSPPVTVVFGREPQPGDIRVDGNVNLSDLEKLAGVWLQESDGQIWNPHGQAALDRFDRADINRDYHVNLLDLNDLSLNWNK